MSLALQLTDYWYIAEESRRLRNRPVAATVLGQRLALFRGADGRPAAVLDRCAHRNAPLSAGRVSGGCVECPYHGWSYNAEGRCVDMPSLRRDQEPPSRVGIRAYPTAESQGYVWVWMGEGAADGQPPRFGHLGERGWTTFRMRTRFPAGALSCLENFLDCPHTVYVHQGWFRSRNAKEVRARVTQHAEGVDAEFFEERDAESVVSKTLFPKQGKLVHTDRFLMPTTSRVDYSFGPDRHFVITSQCTPISEHETEVYTVITFRYGRIAPLVRLYFEPMSRRIIRQDVDILRLQTEQLRRFGGPDFTFVKTDLVGGRIWEMWRRAVSGKASQPATPVVEDVVLLF